jgi:hypothetical protein
VIWDGVHTRQTLSTSFLEIAVDTNEAASVVSGEMGEKASEP